MFRNDIASLVELSVQLSVMYVKSPSFVESCFAPNFKSSSLLKTDSFRGKYQVSRLCPHLESRYQGIQHFSAMPVSRLSRTSWATLSIDLFKEAEEVMVLEILLRYRASQLKIGFMFPRFCNIYHTTTHISNQSI
jgi:hypothetical protein